eukprot:1160379-Pelagomonas_calceolata.AAC.2
MLFSLYKILDFPLTSVKSPDIAHRFGSPDSWVQIKPLQQNNQWVHSVQDLKAPLLHREFAHLVQKAAAALAPFTARPTADPPSRRVRLLGGGGPMRRSRTRGISASAVLGCWQW